jgi:hypothetical protein
MSSLLELQRSIARNIADPADESSLTWIESDWLAASERLAIHRNTIGMVLVNALRLAYPAVEALVGREFFEASARTFASSERAVPADLDLYGGSFASFLQGFPPAASVVYLPDVARLEWAIAAAANAPDVPALSVDALNPLQPQDHGRTWFLPHPSLRLVTLDYPAVEIRQAVLAGDDTALEALVVTSRRRDVLVHRNRLEVIIRQLTRDDARFTAALCRGVPLGALDTSPDLIPLLADHLAQGRFAAISLAPAEPSFPMPNLEAYRDSDE